MRTFADSIAAKRQARGLVLPPERPQTFFPAPEPEPAVDEAPAAEGPATPAPEPATSAGPALVEAQPEAPAPAPAPLSPDRVAPTEA